MIRDVTIAGGLWLVASTVRRPSSAARVFSQSDSTPAIEPTRRVSVSCLPHVKTGADSAVQRYAFQLQAARELYGTQWEDGIAGGLASTANMTDRCALELADAWIAATREARDADPWRLRITTVGGPMALAADATALVSLYATWGELTELGRAYVGLARFARENPRASSSSWRQHEVWHRTRELARALDALTTKPGSATAEATAELADTLTDPGAYAGAAVGLAGPAAGAVGSAALSAVAAAIATPAALVGAAALIYWGMRR